MSELKKLACEYVGQIPAGRVMTYGQLAALAGHPRAARAVGQIAHFGSAELPWHRVVNKTGGLASGYWGGKRAHAQALKAEKVEVKNLKINVQELIWWPNE